MNIAFARILSFSVMIIIGISFVQTANAQLDTTFGTNGTVVTDFNGDDRLIDSFVLPDSKILTVVAGTLNGQTRYYLARYNSNGTLDAGYGTNGIKQLSFPAVPNAVFIRAARQSSGKIILGGSNGANGLVVSLNEDGTLNTAFAGGGIQQPNFNPTGDDKVDALGVQPDDKIVISSAFSAFQSSQYLYFARYLPDGTLDSTFGDGGTIYTTNPPSNVINTILFQSNGKIITLGTAIRRLNADGRMDNSFPTIVNPYRDSEISFPLI
ncbi:MAG: hypothetical protein M3T96_09455, partial [Acidobacteriota bacterium]|nr:hypothetical protein [Acidobacteriota bacterium]